MFDYTAVGALLTLVGVAFLVAFSWLLLPHRQRTEGALADAIAIKNYTVEASIEPESASAGKTVSELLQLAGGSVTILSILKNGSTEVKPLPDVRLGAGDTLVLEGDNESIDRLASLASLGLTGRRQLGEQDAESSELAAVEAVVGEQSALVGSSAQDLQLFDTHRINVLAVSRKNHRLKQKLGQVRLRAGDVLVLQGSSARLPEFLRNMGLLPLVERNLQMGLPKNGGLAIAILGAAMALTALALVPVAVAFFAAAVLMVLTGIIPLRDMYRSVEGPILVMLAALIPVSDALRSTGVTDIIAQRLAEAGTGLPSYAAVALIMVAAMAVTPFLNNAATVLVMAPIAAQFAGNLGYKPEAFLLAVAIGAGCDFLTPVGHQCNTLVMAPGGYRFSDYARLGLPLSVLVVLIAVPSLMWFWAL
jgi:di/tricarboxylate transporter